MSVMVKGSISGTQRGMYSCPSSLCVLEFNLERIYDVTDLHTEFIMQFLSIIVILSFCWTRFYHSSQIDLTVIW